MPNDLTPKPPTGRVVIPHRNDARLPIEPPLRGIPLLNRMRYRSVRKELEEYLSVLQAKNNILRAVNETARLGEEYNRSLVRAERLDDLRQIEALKIDAELDRALEDALSARRNAQANALGHRLRMAELEADAIAAETRLNALKSPPEPPPPEQKLSPAERVTAEIKKLRDEEGKLVAALVEEAGGEAALSAEDRELLNDVRLAMRNRIANLVDELAQ